MMNIDETIKRRLEEHQKRTQSRGFTLDYQQAQESAENVICHKALAPVTIEKYETVALHWLLFKMSRGQIGEEAKLSKDTPLPKTQELKNFVESFVTSRRDLPCQSSTLTIFNHFVSKWYRDTFYELPEDMKKDVRNFIRTTLTKKYALRTKPRDSFHVTAKDIQFLLYRLFVDDWHDYTHERLRIQVAGALSLFAGSGARAGAIVESSSYPGTNECLYYKHIELHVKWSGDGKNVIRWVSISPEFLKGYRYRDDTKMPINWFNEHPVLGFNFVFWVIVHGVADNAFKNLSSLEAVLAMKPPKGRGSFTFQWNEESKKQPFFRMVKSDGPDDSKALTFSSLRHHFSSLAERDGFKDKLRVHGIRGGVANKLDPNVSQAARSQALDHRAADTFRKYQAPLKAVDIQAAYHGLVPSLEGRDMQQSMEHHRDSNVPLHLDAAANNHFEADPNVISISERIARITQKIDRQPQQHPDLVKERASLYADKTKLRKKLLQKFKKDWWETSYDEYTSGNNFSEKDTTSLFDIYRKYTPERDRLSKDLFREASIDSETGKQCLTDLITICSSTEYLVYYPGLQPDNGQCPRCRVSMSSLPIQVRAKHILQCERYSRNGAQYQQLYKNNKRAHRRVNRNYLEFCYLCAEMVDGEEEWKKHCQIHIENLTPRCGMLRYRNTLISPGLCPFCLSDGTKEYDARFRQWRDKSTLLNHIDEHLRLLKPLDLVSCPHPCCENREYKGTAALQRHFFDAHSLEEPRPNCQARKRRWGVEETETAFTEHTPFKKNKVEVVFMQKVDSV
ncbi:unnamed protein product [Penicillium salamii]|nr:unnamed protein product [Penicillium salamii]